MRVIWTVVVMFAAATSALAVRPAVSADGAAAPIEVLRACAGKDGYTDAAPPVRIFGNTYYVGTCGISAILIVGDRGDVLIDGGPAEAAPLVATSIARLGVRATDIKILLNSHEHYDHAGGLARLKLATGAKLYARQAAKPALEAGMPARGDPQRDLHQGFPPVRVDVLVPPRGRVRLGSVELAAIETPGHTPGSTSWSWRSCEQGRCATLVYADSLSAVSADNYRFSDHPAVVAAFRSTFGRVAGLRCDLVLSPHPGATRLFERLAGESPLIDRGGCAAYAASARDRLDARLRREQKH